MTTIKSRYNVTQQEAIELVATLLANNPSTNGLYYQLCHSMTIWITSLDPLDKSYATDPKSLALESLQLIYNDLKDLVEPGDPTPMISWTDTMGTILIPSKKLLLQ